jgi:DNA repair protein RecO (recombination protein O)
MADFETDAILLRRVEYGDHDLIINFLTRDRGKIPVIAKNAKQSVKRFSGALDLFSGHRIQCTFPKKNRDGLIILTGSQLTQGFANIRYDVLKTAYACYWIEMLSHWLEDGKPQQDLFELLHRALFMLHNSGMQSRVISLLFQIRFMSISGFAPRLDVCESCQRPLDSIGDGRIRFDFAEGRIICSRCRQGASRHGMQVSKGTLKQLSWINTVDMDRTDRIKFAPFAIREGQVLLESFIPFHIGREFKSLAFLRRIRKTR